LLARAGEASVRPKPIKSDDRLESALKLLRQFGNQSRAAKEAGVSAERFRRFLKDNALAERRGRFWKVTDQRQREMLVVSRGEVQRRDCGMCGESDWRTIEQHHVADYGRDETVALLCRNCHRKVSDDQKDHPAPFVSGEPMLETIGHFLLGLADMLRTIAPRLQAFGRWLIEYARGMQVTL